MKQTIAGIRELKNHLSAYLRRVRAGEIIMITDRGTPVAHIPVTEALVRRAGALGFDENLRGYDAVQLPSALVWKEGIGEELTFATFDIDLWGAAGRHHLVRFPEDLPNLLNA